MAVTSVQMNGALAQLLGDFRGRDVVVLLNHGNRGDGLAHLGGRQFLGELALTVRECGEADDLGRINGEILLIHGAGASARRGRKLQKLLKWVAPRFAEIVLLPDSYDLSVSSVRAFAQSWSRKFHVFCRELVSFDVLRRLKTNPKSVLLGHDLTFHLDLGPWSDRRATGRAGLFRRDAEAGHGVLPRELDVVDDAARGSERDPLPLLDFAAGHAELHTDRVRAAIVAARLGRSVTLYRNINFKNEAVYHHSLAVLPHVHFIRRTPFSLGQYLRAAYWAARGR